MAEDDLWSTLQRLSGLIECRTVFDVGAHQGGLTEWFLQNFPNSTIYAFELDQRNFETLFRKVQTDLSPQISSRFE